MRTIIDKKNHHCFFPFFFLLLLLLPPLAAVPLLFELLPALAVGLSVEVLPLKLSNNPACTAFCNHSRNSSSVIVSSKLGGGIRPPRCPELVPLLVLCLEVTLVFTWKLGLWVLAGHLIPWKENQREAIMHCAHKWMKVFKWTCRHLVKTSNSETIQSTSTPIQVVSSLSNP